MTISSNKTIAKNTLFLYLRMMFTMIIALFTSRIILQKLGIEDFGIYQTVGGIVSLLSFIQSSLNAGTSRFLTFEIGTGNLKKLKCTFSTALITHLCLSFIVVIIAETIGLWFVCNKLVLSPDRLSAALFAYQMSIITSFISITQVPYGAIIISHERMDVYAYMSIVEVSLKLAIVYLLSITNLDKLKLYSSLLCILQVSTMLYYRFYCAKHYNEAKFNFKFDKKIFKSILSYSSWNLFGHSATALATHGTTILINMFFNPSVVTGRSIANQVNFAANQFIKNFRTASNPQIIKKYAAKDYNSSKNLMINSTKISFYMMLALALPICLVSKTLLRLWLGLVPEYSVTFLQLTIITSLFMVFDASFYVPLYAKGRIKENALIVSAILSLSVITIYFLLKLGYGPETTAWVLLIDNIIISLIIKPILLIKIVGYHWHEILQVFFPCLKVSIVSIPIPIILYFSSDILLHNEITSFLVLSTISMLCVVSASWLVGIDNITRNKIIITIKQKFSSKKERQNEKEAT